MRLYILIALISSSSACQKPDGNILNYPSLGEVPHGFPEIEYPDDNGFTQSRWELGKKLFYDPIMSQDRSVSCASCHHPGNAFSDNKAVSIGANDEPGTRNSPSLANVGYLPYFTREGGVPSLEMQILVPIQEHNEFNTNILTIAERLNEDEEYVRLSNDAYERNPDPYVITRAIANFERTLISGESKYDLFLRGEQTLSVSELRGMTLFFGNKTNCSSCHSGFNFTNNSFRNNGLYQTYSDVGRFRLTRDSADLALFKVPTLRNIELTAPYMHNGAFNNLESVIDHYNSGGKNHINKGDFIKPLHLTIQEKQDLIAFLETLTDYAFITNKTLHEE